MSYYKQYHRMVAISIKFVQNTISTLTWKQQPRSIILHGSIAKHFENFWNYDAGFNFYFIQRHQSQKACNFRWHLLLFENLFDWKYKIHNCWFAVVSRFSQIFHTNNDYTQTHAKSSRNSLRCQENKKKSTITIQSVQ